MLPDFNKTEGSKWSVIACDQHTSEPEYWEKAESLVGNSPSALELILPEVYLSETEKRVPKINMKLIKRILKLQKQRQKQTLKKIVEQTL